MMCIEAEFSNLSAHAAMYVYIHARLLAWL